MPGASSRELGHSPRSINAVGCLSPRLLTGPGLSLVVLGIYVSGTENEIFLRFPPPSPLRIPI